MSRLTTWQKESEKLKSLLKPDDWESARASTLNSHYTSPEIIQAMYRRPGTFGFKGGRILEPACGVGHFIGLMPETMHRTSQITGIELDSITARIAQTTLSRRRHPAAAHLKRRNLPDGGFDLAVSNVPFGDYQPYDKQFNAHKYPIHDYFFAASMERVRPGGLVAFITTKGTIDKQSPRLRRQPGQASRFGDGDSIPQHRVQGQCPYGSHDRHHHSAKASCRGKTRPVLHGRRASPTKTRRAKKCF